MKKKLPQTLAHGQIQQLSHEGRGVARIEGKTTFIDGALPGEEVTFLYTRKKKDYDEGRIQTIHKASAARVVPRCLHYELCGGCSLQHLNPEDQILEKQQILLDLLQRIGHCMPERVLSPLTSAHWNYRHKARLSTRFVAKKQTVLIGFREKNNPRFITEINHCPVLHAQVEAQIPKLREVLTEFDDQTTIAQIEVAAGDDEVALIFRNLNPLTIKEKEILCQFGQQTGFKLFLQPGGANTVHLFYPEDAGEFLTYALPAEQIHFHFHPTDFTQVNAGLNRLMVGLALDLMNLSPNDLVLDLFCGLGNFSLPLAKRCAKVVGIEGSDTMVKRAQNNAEANGILNTQFFCANLEQKDYLSMLGGQKFTKLLLDPPRSGALTIVQHIEHLAPQRIVYVSCNPATLARDSDVLVNHKGYSLRAAGVMDMFPHTAHVESIALFEKDTH